MPFRFSLERVLDHRNAQEERAQRAFGEAMQALEVLRAEKRAIEEEVADRVAEVRARQQAGLVFALRRIYEDWIAAQREKLPDYDRRIAEAAAETERRRLELVAAVQARMVMEELRERELEAYRVQEAREETKQFDEIAARKVIERQIREKRAAGPERIAQ